MFEFKRLSIVTAFVAMSLCLLLLFFPRLIFMIFDVQENASAIFMGRRMAMLFLCIAIFSWAGRKAQHSESRQAICLGLSISLSALGLLGAYEYFVGHAGIGICLAIMTEMVLALSYFKIWLSHKNAYQTGR